MKKINLRDYYPYYTQDMIVEVPDEVALLLREYMLLEEAYRIRTYRYKAFYSLDRDEGIERDLDLVDTDDIATFSILKDASASAV